MTQSFRVLHISDLHFGRTSGGVVEGLVSFINADEPDCVIVSGDLTQTAHPKEFREARAFLDRLHAPTVVIPGNHDIPGWQVWSRLVNGFKRYKSHIDPCLDTVHQGEQAVIVGLNTARRIVVHWNWSHGALHGSQLQLVETVFDDAPDDHLRLVTLHHPLVPPADRPRQKLVGNARAAAAHFSLTRTDAVLTGHLHTTQSQLAGQYHPGLTWDYPVIQTATTTSSRLRGQENGLSRLIWADNRLEVQSWTWDGTQFRQEADDYFIRHAETGWSRLT